jgi:formylglycine-generating enzyme required for sulfatase activity
MRRAASWLAYACALGALALSSPHVVWAKGERSKGDGAAKGAKGGKKRPKDAPKEAAPTAKKKKKKAGCPADMVSIRGEYCVDRYEAYVAEVHKGGKLKKHSPYAPLNAKKKYKALNRKGRMPQGYISRDEAASACDNAGKRLCTDEEWITACKGKKPTDWPYGDERKPGRCNDEGVSAFQIYFGADGAYTWENLNDPRLNQHAGTCAPAGKHSGCKNSFKVYDMVGNLHEWTADPGGTFRGGYYLDVTQHGDGCNYKTTAHHGKYHDYSTGFRCCL